MPVNNKCLICGRADTQDAHVKPRREFSPHENDRYHNILKLCRVHHNEYFDCGRVGICPDKSKLIIEQAPGNIEIIHLNTPLNIKDEYVEFRNRLCKDRVRHAMGLTHDNNRNLCE